MTNKFFVDPTEFSRQIAAYAGSEMQPGIDPHLTHRWFQLLAETAVPEGARLALANVGQDSFFPLMTRPDQPGRLLALSTFYTPLFGLINEPLADPSALGCLASALRKRDANFYEARFAPMNTDSRSYQLLREAFKSGGWLVDDYFSFGNWYYPVEGKSYAAYLAERPSRLRNTIERAGKKLTRSGDFSLEIICGGDRLEGAIADFVTVYNRSWKVPEPFIAFIPGLCRLATQQGWLRLGVARLKGQPIAAQLWLVASGKAHIVKLAYDESFAKTSAGTVLTAALIRYVIETDAVDEVDYLMGDDPYKKEWMSQRRERRGLIAFNKSTLFGLAAASKHYGGKLYKALINR